MALREPIISLGAWGSSKGERLPGGPCPEAKGLGYYPDMRHLWLPSRPQPEEGSLAEAVPIHQEQPPKKQAAVHPAQLGGGCPCWFYTAGRPQVSMWVGSRAGCLWPW